MSSLLADNLDYLDKDKYYNRQWVVTPREAYDFTKGRVVGLPAGLMDVAGMLQGAGNPYTGEPLYPQGVPQQRITGDPVRDYYGTNNPAGLLGEFFDPVGRVAKVAKGVGGLLQSAPDIAKAVGEGGLLNYAMTLFHGTRHKFDMFDLQKIGTGEGVQAYGHGLYFAESPGVAKSYQRDLTDFRLELDGKQLFREDAPDELVEVIDWVFQDPRKRGVKAYKEFIEGEEEFASRALDSDDAGVAQMARDIIEENKKRRAVMAKYEGRLKDAEGHLYEVDIPDETIAKMLDWDAPLSEQPELRKAIESLPSTKKRLAQLESSFGELNGEQVYEMLAQLKSRGMSRDQRFASKWLSDMGFPGIRYLDQSSRGKWPAFQVVSENKNAIKGKISTGATKHADAEIVQTQDGWQLFVDDETVGVFESPENAMRAANRKFAPDGTRNIVVFNPDDIKSVKRDGELVYKAGK